MIKSYQDCNLQPFDYGDIDISHNVLLFTLVSCMCNNVSYLKIVRDTKEDKCTMNHYNDHCSLAISNLQMSPGGN